MSQLFSFVTISGGKILIQFFNLGAMPMVYNRAKALQPHKIKVNHDQPHKIVLIFAIYGGGGSCPLGKLKNWAFIITRSHSNSLIIIIICFIIDIIIIIIIIVYYQV